MNSNPKTHLPHPEACATGAVSAYGLEAVLRYRDLLGELIPIANCSGWRSKEETHEALQHLVERALGGTATRLPGPGANPDRGRDR